MSEKYFKNIMPVSLIVSIIILLFSPQVYTQNKTQNIDKLLSLCHNYRLFNGTALIAENGKVIYKKGFGLADRRWNIQNGSDIKYMNGSVSKQFTAMLILQLAEEGKLQLDDKITKYLPDYPKDKGDKITIHHLLCHSTGIPDISKIYDNFFSEIWMKEHTDEEFIKLFCDLDLDFEPGTQFYYNSAGYFLLGVIIEKVTGEKFSEVLKEKILAPLNMYDSGAFDYYSILPRMASGYEFWNFRFTNTGFVSPTIHKGAGSMYSTVEDMFKWDRALYAHKLLSKKYMDMLFHPHMTLRGNASYAYGWVVGEKSLSGTGEQVGFTEHSGVYNGFYAIITRLTDDNHAIILLTNTSDAIVHSISNEIINILYDRPYHVSKPFSLVLDECKDLKEIQTAIYDYQNSEHDYSYRRDAINGVGFKLMLDEKHDMGLAVLEFNTEEHPHSHFVHESLGEAYLKAGKTELAIKHLKKTLELDPKNEYAKKKLKGLEEKEWR